MDKFYTLCKYPLENLFGWKKPSNGAHNWSLCRLGSLSFSPLSFLFSLFLFSFSTEARMAPLSLLYFRCFSFSFFTVNLGQRKEVIFHLSFVLSLSSSLLPLCACDVWDIEHAEGPFPLARCRFTPSLVSLFSFDPFRPFRPSLGHALPSFVFLSSFSFISCLFLGSTHKPPQQHRWPQLTRLLTLVFVVTFTISPSFHPISSFHSEMFPYFNFHFHTPPFTRQIDHRLLMELSFAHSNIHVFCPHFPTPLS